MSDFEAASAIRPRGETGTYDVDLHPGWAIGGKPNGGYLLALLGRAACDITATAHPLAISGHFLRAPEPGPAVVRTELVRQGRRVSTTRAVLWQGDKPFLDTLVSSGDLPGGEAEWRAGPPPTIPPPQECPPGDNPKFPIELFEHVELRADPATTPFPAPTGEPVIRFWFRLRDGAPPDVFAAIVAADSGPPTVFNLSRYGWAPTVELTVLVRGAPAAGWLLCEARTESVAGGWFDEQATVWDATGRLVAQSRQLALAGNA